MPTNHVRQLAAGVAEALRSEAGRAGRDGRVRLSEVEAKSLVRQAGIPTPPFEIVHSGDEAARAAHALGLPLVAKLVSPQLAHKTDVGGVVLNLRSPEEAAAAFDRLRSIGAEHEIDVASSGVLVESMFEGELEVIVGVRRDPALGYFLVLGPGGRLAELMGRPAVRALPVDRDDAKAMVAETALLPLLTGYRGSPPLDLEGLVDTMVRLGELAEISGGSIAEFELNPVLVGRRGRGVSAVDAYGELEPSRPDGGGPADDPAALRRALRALLSPEDVAVVGASADPKKFGNWLMRYLIDQGFPGRLYPVNPRGGEILGHDAYPTIEELPASVDVAAIVVPPEATPAAVKACSERGVRAAVVFASGFAEAGRTELERELVRAVREGGIRVCGPNTIGLIRPSDRACLTFSNLVANRPMLDGPVAVVSQSGAIGGSLVSRLWDEGIGVSFWVSAGNESDLEMADYLTYAAEDDRTRVVAVFLEGIKDGPRFAAAAARCREAGKAIVAYKSGSSESGSRAVRTHTGKLAGDPLLYSAFFHRCSILEVTELEEAIDAVKALTRVPVPAGGRVASLSPSGGAGSIVADEAERAGLRLAVLSAATQDELRELDSGVLAENPVDIGGVAFQRPESFGQALRALLADEEVDAVILPITTVAEPVASAIAEQILEAADDADKPILVAWLPGTAQTPEAFEAVSARLPVYRSIRAASRALRALSTVGGAGARPN